MACKLTTAKIMIFAGMGTGEKLCFITLKRRTMKNLKLNRLAENKLSEKEMESINGGAMYYYRNDPECRCQYLVCACGCQYANSGGSSTNANGNANYKGGIIPNGLKGGLTASVFP